jgi:hypothetical protein
LLRERALFIHVSLSFSRILNIWINSTGEC